VYDWTFSRNIAAALLMGVAIGLERQYRQHTAGLRTNALVALGAALFVSLSRLMDDQNSPTRIASYVVSGIGFLGGGVILREGLNVRGMNTAATLWCSAAVGTLAGAGFPAHAATGTVAILLTHLALRPLVRAIESKSKTAVEVETLYRLRVVSLRREEGVVRAVLMRHINSQPRMTVQGISTQDAEQADRVAVVAEIFSSERNDRIMNEMTSRLSIEPGISAVSWERAR
jgi:putative Mg2+ transporter-C (MgtC) family protein